MYAYKVVVTTLLAGIIAMSGYIATKDTEKSSKYVGIGLGLIMTLAIAAIWM